MDYFTVRQFDAYVAACAGRAGVKVEWDAANSVPRTDGKTIWIPRLTSSTADNVLMRLRVNIKHETSHIVDSDFEFLQASKMTKFEAMVNNLVEDYRVDFRNDMEYRGDIPISESFYEWFAGEVVKRGKSADADSWIKLLPLFMWDCSMRTYLATASLVVEAGRSVISASTEAQCRFGMLVSGTYGEELVALLVINDKTEAAKAVLKLAKRIVKEVYEEPTSEEEEKEEPTKAEGGDGDTDGEGEKSITSKDIDAVAECMSAPHTVAPEDDTKAMGAPDSKRKGWVIPAASDYMVVRGKEMPEAYARYCSDTTIPAAAALVDSLGKPLANNIRLLLQTRSKDRYETGVRKGKLHAGSLHRILSGDSKQAERVFKKRVVSTTLDTAVMLLVDCSGSMAGSKYRMAAAAATTIGEALRPLGMSHSILGFTCVPFNDREPPLMRWFKDWDERNNSTETIRRFAQMQGILGQNADGDSLAYANYMLMQRKEARKMLIVLSDGEPCGRSWAGDERAWLSTITSNIEASKQVELYGIGIEDSSVKRFYKNHVVLMEASNLIPAVMQILGKL
jgi:hypothetical protein